MIAKCYNYSIKSLITVQVNKHGKSPLAVALCKGKIDFIKYPVKECYTACNIFNGESSAIMSSACGLCWPGCDIIKKIQKH